MVAEIRKQHYLMTEGQKKKKRRKYNMESSAKSLITFSINGILSTDYSRQRQFCGSDRSRVNVNNDTIARPSFYSHVPTAPTYNHVTTVSNRTSERHSFSTTDQIKTLFHETVYKDNHKRSYYDGEHSRSPTPISPEQNTPYLILPSLTSPPLIPPSLILNKWSPQIDKAAVQIQDNEKGASPTGRFRPPPFFETVLGLRKRLYYLGGKVFPLEEPPTDRNIHKLWRAVEKHKVTYSLQHYFYVACLSNRCFDLVDRINHKVSCGILEGSREKEANQSYFNFLYGKTEDERYRLLSLLEIGEISPKNFVKLKQSSYVNKPSQDSPKSCHRCEVVVNKLKAEKEKLERKYQNLNRKFDLINETRTKSLVHDVSRAPKKARDY